MKLYVKTLSEETKIVDIKKGNSVKLKVIDSSKYQFINDAPKSEKIKKLITIKKMEGIEVKGKADKINIYEVSDYEKLKNYNFYESGFKDEEN